MRLALIGALGLTCLGCSLLNKLDVCERPPPKEYVANVRAEGDQLTSGNVPFAIMPSGGGFLAFSSEESGAEANTEIRGTFIDAAGQRLPTCSEPNEFTFAEPTAGSGLRLATAPSVAAPHSTDTSGLIAFLRVEASSEDLTDATSTVHALPFDRFGCPVRDVGEVRIDDTDEGFSYPPMVVRLGADRFALFWIHREFTYRAMGRLMDTSKLIAEFPSTAPRGDPSDGDPVDILPEGPLYSGLFALPLSDTEFAIAWTEVTLSGPLVARMAIFDDRFVMQEGPFDLNGAGNGVGPPPQNRIGVAYDGKDFLVVWTVADEAGRSRIFARYVRRDGSLPISPEAKGNGFFRVGQSEVSEEGRPFVTAQKDGGFLVSWEESSGDTGGAEGARDIRAASFNPERERAFTNRSCGTEIFTLNQGTSGHQERPALGMHPDGSIAAIWTDLGSNDINQRGTASVVSTVFTPEQLFPTK